MRAFSTVVEVATGSSAGSFITLLGLKFGSTTGHRGRLRRLIVAGAGGAPQDEQVTVQMRRTDNTADGTSTSVSTTTIGQHDPASLGTDLSAAGKNYSAEPTTKDTEILGGGALNARGNLTLDWRGDPDGAPQWGPTQTLCIEGAPGQATAVNLAITVEWEEF